MATASARRAARVRRRLPRVRAPLQPDGLAVWEQGRAEDKSMARQSSSCIQTRGADYDRTRP
jgi:hypothetical protein